MKLWLQFMKDVCKYVSPTHYIKRLCDEYNNFLNHCVESQFVTLGTYKWI